jgi:hypothetical protein
LVEITWRDLDQIQKLIHPNNRPYKIKIENISSVTLQSGETVGSSTGLTVVTLSYDDQRDGEYQSRYLVGSMYTGGAAIPLAP